MNFVVGLIVVMAVLLGIRQVGRYLVAGTRRIGQWQGRLRLKPATGLPQSGTWAIPAPSPWASNTDAADTDAWSPAVRRDLLGRLSRDPDLLEPLVRLELAIAIKRREIELARLKAEKAGIRAAARARRTGRPVMAVGAAEPARVPADHLTALRKAAGLGARQRRDEPSPEGLDSGPSATAKAPSSTDAERYLRH
jgi:hypothetical protein